MRIFSIPFNRVSYKEYETLLKRYKKEQIHSIYFSLPEIDNHLYEEQEEDVSKDFLRNSMDYKRLVVYNDGCYPYDDKELFRHMDKCIFPLIEKYRIDGFIVTNVNLSRYIKQNFPNMEMHLSCKNPSYHVKQTKNWINYGKIDVVNSPREFGRMPSLLKEFHKHGIKQKIILNSACVFGCANHMNHNTDLGLKFNNGLYCGYENKYKWLQTCMILPRWMKHLDPYVDIYKLTGRFRKTKDLIMEFDIYINNENATYLSQLALGCVFNSMSANGIDIPLELIPDKLLWCEEKECETCTVCDSAYNKIMKLYNC